MNYTKHIAAKAYEVYLNQSKGQLSPDDALWITDQYLIQNPNAMIEDAIKDVIQQLLQEE